MSFERKKILIIDDEPSILRIYTKMLVELGFTARWALNADNAMDILIREKIDLVLLDIKMPGVDGKTMFEVIHEYDPMLKVIVSSVYAVERQKELIPCARDYFDKSRGLPVLIEKMMGVLFEEAGETDIKRHLEVFKWVNNLK
ncbi:MAG: response regulator [Candidatus Omnitrophica bacterium]|nr:response regulator [Candidatus Omnitrophota bacterium]MDE2008681.1 response regulator [Candidatus Omnitrophota bacterium]MDE2214822.1 response regulator [Candidatus Omnitrophota bacterium]MDE2231942.1 response regulator [Candidatus Omnitrophota bacterium]